MNETDAQRLNVIFHSKEFFSLLKESLKMPYLHEISGDDNMALQIGSTYTKDFREYCYERQLLFSKEPLKSYDSSRIKFTKI